MPVRGRTFAPGGTALLGLSPQYVTPSTPDQGVLQGQVSLVERLGSETVVDLAMADGPSLIAAFSEDKQFERGERIDLAFDPAQTHLLHPD